MVGVGVRVGGGVGWIGRRTLALLGECGAVALLAADALRWSLRRPLRPRLFLDQSLHVGVLSLPVVAITGAFTGMVLALQTASAFRLFGAENLVASVVSLSMTRELGPVLTGLMVAGRVGSAMAAELGTMRVTEQIDALHTLATHPVQYLVVPRLWAATWTMPALVLFSNLVGILGGRFVAVAVVGTSPFVYDERAAQFLDLEDIGIGLLKAALFGFTLALVGCYQGYSVRGGAREVGLAVNRAVVHAIALILIVNYLVTGFFFA
jgi:phospholipid/cholesterol/gamma-HCH transport system permease protein